MMTVPSSEAAPASTPPEPSDLAVAIAVAQRVLATFGDVSVSDLATLNRAYGGFREALRILLRAVDAEPENASLPRETSVPLADERKVSVRCPAAHPDDPTPCTGPPTVTVLDATNAGADGCQHHGARLLASLEGGRVYALPNSTPGTAIRVFKAADGIRPFPWLTDAPRTGPSQLSRAETHRGGEGQ